MYCIYTSILSNMKFPLVLINLTPGQTFFKYLGSFILNYYMTLLICIAVIQLYGITIITLINVWKMRTITKNNH